MKTDETLQTGITTDWHSKTCVKINFTIRERFPKFFDPVGKIMHDWLGYIWSFRPPSVSSCFVL